MHSFLAVQPFRVSFRRTTFADVLPVGFYAKSQNHSNCEIDAHMSPLGYRVYQSTFSSYRIAPGSERTGVLPTAFGPQRRRRRPSEDRRERLSRRYNVITGADPQRQNACLLTTSIPPRIVRRHCV